MTTQGSIPAYAGEPSHNLTGGTMIQVYPRVCGGTLFCAMLSGSLAGLSPRMRGNRAQRGRRGSGRRSIPAYAGEPPTALGGGSW